jgi:hypothetical protein
MASSGKKKTTMAKLMRESKQRERRQDKQARKEARKQSSGEPADWLGEPLDPTDGETPVEPDQASIIETAVQAPTGV